MKLVDAKTALKSMLVNIGIFLLKAAIYCMAMTLGIAVLAGLGYVLMHYPLQLASVFVVLVLAAWFVVELKDAEATREFNEKYNK